MSAQTQSEYAKNYEWGKQAGDWECNETPHFDKCFDRETARCVECDTWRKVGGQAYHHAQHCFTRGTTTPRETITSLTREGCRYHNLWDPAHGWNCDWITAGRDLDPCAADAASCSGDINRDAKSPCGLNFSPTCSFLELGKCATGGGKSQLTQGQQSGGHGDPEKSQCVECERDRSDIWNEFKMMQECDSATAVAILRAVMTRRPPCRRYLTTVVKLPKQNFLAASACQIKELGSNGLLGQLCPAGTEAIPSRGDPAPPVTVDGPCNLNPAGRLLARRHSMTI